MNKHSPAPWKEDGDLILAADGTAILQLDPYGAQDEETLFANGYLVRSAPLLLAAAEEVLFSVVRSKDTAPWRPEYHKLRAAVARARGGVQ